MKTNLTVPDVITDRFIAAIKESGKLPWQKTWKTIIPRNGITGYTYNGVNFLMTQFLGTDTLYLTFKQIDAAGGRIVNSANSLPIVFAVFKEELNTLTGKMERIFKGRRYYTVFPLNDTTLDGQIKRPNVQSKFSPDETAERILAALGCPISYGSNNAAYSPHEHSITLPLRESFKDTLFFYKTAFHEATHAMAKEAGHKTEGTYGSDPYAKEELVAELGAAFLLNACGLDGSGCFDNSAAYLQGWLSKFAGDTTLLLTAASAAQYRVNLLLKKAQITQAEEVAPVEAVESAAA